MLIKKILHDVNELNKLFETYLDSDYLVSNAPDYMFMDWARIDEFNAHHPPAVIGMGYMTAFYYKSLLDAAYLNNLAGNTAISSSNPEPAQKVKSGMNRLFWDEEKQLYKDGIPFRNNSENHFFFPEDKDIVTYSPHVNALVVLYDIAAEEKQSAILHYLVTQDEIVIQPYFMYFVLSAVEHIGKFNTKGIGLLEKWEEGIELETYTLKENWQSLTETGYRGDYSHSWGGSPLYFMSRNILGVKTGNAASKEITINIFSGENINWAKGRVPLMNGKYMDISWKKENSEKYIYEPDIPYNHKASIVFPKELSRKTLVINDKIYPKGTESVRLISGTYEIELKGVE